MSVDTVHEIVADPAVTLDDCRPLGTLGGVVSGVSVAPGTVVDCTDSLPAASYAVMAYVYDVAGVRPVSWNDVVADVPATAPSR